MDYKETAKEIVEAVGKNNIIDLTHCATRLRFKLHDVELVNENKLNDIDSVDGFLELNDQFQVFVELREINSVYDEVKALLKS